MFGLMYFAWLGIAIWLVAYLVVLILRLLREPEERKKTLGVMAGTLAAIAVVTWPFLLGRALFEVRCRTAAGLSVERTLDLHDNGYVIWPDEYDEWISSGQVNFRAKYSGQYDHQALQDLLLGRIAFFEKAVPYLSSSTWKYALKFERYFIDDSRGHRCVDARTSERLLMDLRLPAGRCLASSQSQNPQSQYRLRGDVLSVESLGEGQSALAIQLEELHSRDSVARYRVFSQFSGLMSDAGTKRYECPARGASFNHAPLRGLTTFALRDPDGEITKMSDLAGWQAAARRADAWEVREFPPREITGQPSAASANTCRIAQLPDKYHLYTLKMAAARNPIRVNLDAGDYHTGQMEVVVRNPAMPVVLAIAAGDETIWHILRDVDTHVSAVLVQSDYGQAVLGVDRSVPLFIHTSSHSFRSNCSRSEYSALQSAIERAASSRSESTFNGPIAPRFVMLGEGEPEAAGLIYSRDRTLEDFKLEGPTGRLQRVIDTGPLVFAPDPLDSED